MPPWNLYCHVHETALLFNIIVSTLLPFGTKLGDQEITFTEALTVGPFNLEVPIVYYLQREQELYVRKQSLMLTSVP